MIFIITVVRYSHRMDDVEYMNLLLPLLKRILRKDDSAWSELLKMLRARGAAGLGIFPMHEQTSKLLNWTLVKDTRRLPTTKAGRLFAFIQVAYEASAKIAPSLAHMYHNPTVANYDNFFLD